MDKKRDFVDITPGYLKTFFPIFRCVEDWVLEPLFAEMNNKFIAAVCNETSKWGISDMTEIDSHAAGQQCYIAVIHSNIIEISEWSNVIYLTGKTETIKYFTEEIYNKFIGGTDLHSLFEETVESLRKSDFGKHLSSEQFSLYYNFYFEKKFTTVVSI